VVLPFSSPGDAPDFDGDTYDAALDHRRLGAQALRVFSALQAGGWYTLRELATTCGDPEASISARLRDFRKRQFGWHRVEARRRGSSRGLWEYRLVQRGMPVIQEKLLELEIDELVEAGDLDAQILRYAALKADLKILEAQAKRFGAKIIAQLFEQGQVDYAVDDAGKASIGTKTTRTIQPGLLLANGVDAHTIEACTKVSTSDPFLTWRRKGEKETEAD
jgi:hypothetical protein